MDDTEDYLSLFFTECGELLGDLHEHLDAMLDASETGGSVDIEVVNAAFRAVHSIKGGAAAFGFDVLIAFAHVFETVMDRIRSDEMPLSADVAQLLVRAGDGLEVLVEQARDGGGPADSMVDRVRVELEELAGVAPSAAEEAPPAAAPAAAAPAVEYDPDIELETREVVILFAPGPEFMHRGHDPLRVIRAARDIDLVSAEPEGSPPSIEELDPWVCPWSWRLSFDTSMPQAKLLAFFELYDDTAELTVESDPMPEGASPPPPKAAPEAEAAPAELEAAAPVPKSEAKAAAAEGGGASSRTSVSKTLRVELMRIDRLVNLVGEIVITQAVLAQKLSETDAATSLEIGHSVEAMTRQTRELQESVMAIRAQPVKSVFSRMPRVVRDLADTLKKEARLVVSGEHTEVDTTVIEELAEPLTHMLRNSMDHGLEGPEERAAAGKPRTGTIRLSAEHRGERVIITIEDDGRGINRQRVMEKAIENGLISGEEQLNPEDIDQLIFHPGFSTAAEVSSVSGRGVGMDVVKKKIQSLGGRCLVTSTPGKGTLFTITLPLTLAVLDGMTICVGEERFILPLSSVVEALRLENCEIERLPDNSRVLARRGEYLRLLSLRSALGVEGAAQPEEMAIVVDTETNGHVALLVDELIGQRQVVLKSLEANFRRVDGVSGATILGDGRVALILDVPSLVALGASQHYIAQETFH
ncbi:chemotaxis protein CheA [Rhodovulum sp. DZ06]|uniref:chemotaxis protein CheA n=1 Tax=Rhodovulum sp. DZ06 TaxID=3425126 RepID=UPI003D3514DF